jgi:hypothetical protein
MSDDLERRLANLSKFDRDRYRMEVERHEMEIRAREIEMVKRRMEEEMMRQMYAQPPVSSFMPNPFADVDFAPKPKPPTVDPSKLAALKDAEPYRVTERMPDLLGVITAWRAWGVTMGKGGLRLKALGVSHVWEPRKMVDATCTKGKHPAPRMDCECGVWAFKELDGLTSALNKYSEVRVLGNVELWGRVIETENGYRAQYAYPSELWLLDESLEELGLVYDVPVRMIRA